MFLFVLPGAFISLILSSLATGATAGVFWVFIFGDNSWPDYAGKILTAVYGIGLVGGFLASLALGYSTGKKHEVDSELNKRHVLISIILTFVPLLIIVLHQWSVGNIGKKHDSIICIDYCLEQGYSSSGMPPKDSGDESCICYADNGEEVIKRPIKEIPPAK